MNSPTRRRLLLAAGALGMTPLARSREPGWSVQTGHLPPFVIAGPVRPAGALFEVVQALLQAVGEEPEIRVVPWKRAIVLAQEGPRTAVFPLSRLPERESSYRWLVQLYRERYVFFTRHGSDFDIDHPEEMRTRRIAVIRGASTEVALQRLGYQHLVEANEPRECLRYLQAGMADAVFGAQAIVRYGLRDLPDRQAYLLSVPQMTMMSWLAGSHDFTDGDASRLQEAMRVLRASGAYARILANYGLLP
ncbi:MAG TPA: transporter substrate-binding domain-containing protein [Telluria sp.]|nr:transporter substrate-binding domain-containing protein [Telluria sp.]